MNDILAKCQRDEAVARLSYLADIFASGLCRTYPSIGIEDIRSEGLILLISLITKVQSGVVVPQNPGGWVSESLRLALRRWCAEQGVIRVPQSAQREGIRVRVQPETDLDKQRVFDPPIDDMGDVYVSAGLTTHETQISNLRLGGMTNAEIAHYLGVTVRNVQYRIEGIKEKLARRELRTNHSETSALRVRMAQHCQVAASV